MKFLSLLLLTLLGTPGYATTLIRCEPQDGNQGALARVQLANIFSYEDNLMSVDWNPSDLSQAPSTHSERFFEVFELLIEHYQDESGAWTKTAFPAIAGLKFELYERKNEKGATKWGLLTYGASSVHLMCL